MSPTFSTMSSRERLSAALAGLPVDRLPWSPNLAYWWEHSPAAVQDAGQASFLRHIHADPLWRGAPCPVRYQLPPEVVVRRSENGDRIVEAVETPVGVLTSEQRRSPEGRTSFLTVHPLRSRADFQVQLWIEQHLRVVHDPQAAVQHLAGDGREGLSVGMLLPAMKSAFQRLIENLVGTEEMAYAMADFPEEVEVLLAAMVANDERAVRLCAEHGPYDWWITWEDSSTQNYSPRQYQRHIAPQIAAWCRILDGHGRRYMQHACGHVRDLLAPMRASGISAIESVSPRPTGNVQLSEVRTALGSRIGIVGGIEPVEFLNMPDARFDAYVEETIAAGGGGPFVLANSDSCPPGVPVPRFQRVTEIVARH